MESVYAVASSSSSTTYGNIMTSFKEIIMQHFPVNFFKDVNLTSEISYVNIRRRLGRNTLNEMSKLERPYLTINPQIQPPNGDQYLFDIPLTKNFDNMEYGIQKNTLFQLLKNETDGYTLLYKLNRDQIQFEITITVDTLIQQLDLYKYMLNHFVWDRPFTTKSSLEAMIPREMIQSVGLLSNIDIEDADSNPIPLILNMMNKRSYYPITYKMRNGTSLDEFFMYYNVELLINYTDLNIDQVNRKGMADDFYQITFHASVDFNLPGAFVLVGNKPKPKCIDIVLDSRNPDGSHDLIPLYTINNFYSKYSPMKNGFILYTSSRFQTEQDSRTLRDILDMTVLFDQPYIDTIRKYHANNIPIQTLVNIILAKDGEELLEEKDWYMDWNRMNMIIENADDSATYCVIIYINNVLFNENIMNDIEDRQSDRKGL